MPPLCVAESFGCLGSQLGQISFHPEGENRKSGMPEISARPQRAGMSMCRGTWVFLRAEVHGVVAHGLMEAARLHAAPLNLGVRGTWPGS